MKRTRREFIKTAALGTAGLGLGLSARSYARVLGANERLNLGLVGVNSRGHGLAETLLRLDPDGARISHVCDVDARALARTAALVKEKAGHEPVRARDFRRLTEDDGVDALVIATPDHWHATMTLMALKAGKHVYVEKPCSHNPREGEWLVEGQRRWRRVVQMGNQQRSSPETIEAMKAIHGGEIGEVYRANCWYANHRGTIGKGKRVPVPEWLEWDLWQGPAPRTDYRDNVVHYNWHWFFEWGTGELGNNAAHELDICRWALRVDFPERVTAIGGRRFFTDDDWQFYDTLLATYTFPGGVTITWDGQSRNALPKHGRGRGAVIFGTRGSVILDRNGYELYDRAGKLVRRKTARDRSDTMDLKGSGGSLTGRHLKNFLDAIEFRVKPASPIDEGHKSVLLCHLGNIAWRCDRTLRCEPDSGRILDDPSAMVHWKRAYDPEWRPPVK